MEVPNGASGQVYISSSCSLNVRLLLPYPALENIQTDFSFKGVNLFLEGADLGTGSKFNSFTATTQLVANCLIFFINQQPQGEAGLRDGPHTVQEDYGI